MSLNQSRTMTEAGLKLSRTFQLATRQECLEPQPNLLVWYAGMSALGARAVQDQPRMYRTHRGDTWAGLAAWLHVPPARLRARNREAVVRPA
jgi:hypothetical protein